MRAEQLGGNPESTTQTPDPYTHIHISECDAPRKIQQPSKTETGDLKTTAVCRRGQIQSQCVRLFVYSSVEVGLAPIVQGQTET